MRLQLALKITGTFGTISPRTYSSNPEWIGAERDSLIVLFDSINEAIARGLADLKDNPHGYGDIKFSLLKIRLVFSLRGASKSFLGSPLPPFGKGAAENVIEFLRELLSQYRFQNESRRMEIHFEGCGDYPADNLRMAFNLAQTLGRTPPLTDDLPEIQVTGIAETISGINHLSSRLREVCAPFQAEPFAMTAVFYNKPDQMAVGLCFNQDESPLSLRIKPSDRAMEMGDPSEIIELAGPLASLPVSCVSLDWAGINTAKMAYLLPRLFENLALRSLILSPSSLRNSEGDISLDSEKNERLLCLLLSACLRLESLNLSFHRLPSLRIPNLGFDQLPIVLPQLQHLSKLNLGALPDTLMAPLVASLPNCNALRRLAIEYSDETMGPILEALPQCAQLTELRLHGHTSTHNDDVNAGLIAIISALSRLLLLSLGPGVRILGDSVDALAKALDIHPVMEKCLVLPPSMRFLSQDQASLLEASCTALEIRAEIRAEILRRFLVMVAASRRDGKQPRSLCRDLWLPNELWGYIYDGFFPECRPGRSF